MNPKLARGAQMAIAGAIYTHAAARVATNPWRVRPLDFEDHLNHVEYNSRWLNRFEQTKVCSKVLEAVS